MTHALVVGIRQVEHGGVAPHVQGSLAENVVEVMAGAHQCVGLDNRQQLKKHGLEPGQGMQAGKM